MNTNVTNSKDFDDKDYSPTILMIEDSPADARIIKQQIRTVWFKARVVVATSLSQAFEFHKNEQIDLVLLDLNLPDGYGAQTVEEVRKFCKDAPIIVISGMDKRIQEKGVEKLGAVDFIEKDIVMSPDFLSILQRHLTKHLRRNLPT